MFFFPGAGRNPHRPSEHFEWWDRKSCAFTFNEGNLYMVGLLRHVIPFKSCMSFFYFDDVYDIAATIICIVIQM